MADLSNQFRAALHGYNREDVVDYIDRLTQEHEETVLRLQKTNAKLREELTDATEALAAAKNNSESEKSLSDAQRLISDLRNLNEEHEKRIQSLEEELTQAREQRKTEAAAVNTDHEEELERLQRENDKLHGELSETCEALAAARRDAETEQNEAQSLIADLHVRNEDLEAQNRNLTAELEQAQADREMERSSMTQSHAEDLERLQTANEALRNELDAVNAALNAARESTEAEHELYEAHGVIEELRNRNEMLATRIHNMDEELRQVRAEREAEAASTAAEREHALAEQNRNYAELELAAYRRAEQTERLARERAEEVYRQVHSVFGQSNDQLKDCHADLERLAQVMTANVNEMLNVLTALNAAYHKTEDSFAEIGARDRLLLEENG